MADQRDRLEQLLSQQEATIARAFREFIREVNSEAVLAEIADKLARNDVEGALAIVDAYTVRMASVIPVVQQVVGTATAAELAELASAYLLVVSFDASHPRAAQLARANRLNLIREFSAEQRRATRQALARAFVEGTGEASTARAFRNSIGLTAFQEGWVASYERALRTLDGNALRRALRDRRFDRTTESAIRLKKPLTEEQIVMRVDRYRARALIYRSEMISRTEALRSTSQAREEALQQMIEQSNLDPRRITRRWNATRDERVRDWHLAMNGQTRMMGELFEDGNGNRLRYPGDPDAPAETVINCRCALTFSVSPPPA